MGRIFYVMGRSASGKDTIYKKLLETFPQLKRLVTYTTRPMREGEQEGEEYHFTTEQALEECREAGRLIEQRVYQTVAGPWTYATVDDGSFRPEGADSLIGIGTLESWNRLREYYGDDVLFPIYIETDPGTLLERALRRERKQAKPRYTELCRRFLADESDFSEEKIRAAGIVRRYRNEVLEACLAEIVKDMIHYV
ncbi:MAG: guanylate kinase [Lachnospiraceae bacterium]|nr:guanylate kinase [Lachnospiraceae bacterium]